MDFESFKSIALSFPETSMEMHLKKISFRVAKKIFATFDPDTGETVIKLGIYKQDDYCERNPNLMMPVPNKWGKKGWTKYQLADADESLTFQVLKDAFLERAPKILSKKYQRNSEN